MENLGVVPWQLLRAFLLLPDLPRLFALRVRVALVRETILTSKVLLPRPPDIVKLLLGSLFFHLWPGEAKDLPHPIVLNLGEVRELTLKNIKKYTVGDKSVLRVKAQVSNLILKGIKAGTSDLVVWKNTGSSINYQIVVLAGGPHLKGKISDYQTYLLLKNLFSKTGEKFPKNGSLKPTSKLKKKILEEVFYLALKSYRDDLNCQFQNIFLECQFYANIPLVPALKKQLEDKALIRWRPVHSNPQQQFKLKMVIFKFENKDGKFVKFGLDHLEGQLQDLFSKGPISLINQNQVLLNREEITASTLAEPQIIVRTGEPSHIHIGSEIPFSAGGEHRRVEWKFAGLKIEVKAKEWGKKILLNYKTELTAPLAQGSISGNRESSEVLVTLGKPLKLFEIGYRATGDYQSSLPLFSQIPLLGRIFVSTEKKKTYQKISAVLMMERIND